MHNEHRKLVLWLDLFGNSQQTEGEAAPTVESTGTAIASATREARIKATVERLPYHGPPTFHGDLGYNMKDVHALFDLMSTERAPDCTTQEAARRLMDKIRGDMENLSGLSASQLDEDPEQLLKVGAALRALLPTKDFPLRTSAPDSSPPMRKAIVSIDRNATSGQARAMNWTDLPDISRYGDATAMSTEITNDDISMPRSSQSAAKTLQEAKNELMARLQEAAPVIGASGDHSYDSNDTTEDIVEDGGRSMNGNVDSMEDEDEEDEGDEEEDEEEDDEDYRNPGDQERGLLTDVPLVLGPTEIEALPMIIQAGIVDSFGLKGGERNGAKNMQAVRCHILLAQEAGRNVLRELLIFIAAWDLPDDEFYFKMMVQIMEAILQNGLMSHAYSDFGQAKDIISPAQAVVIKILTHIFRSKYSPAAGVDSTGQARAPRPPASLTRVDVLTVRYIFTVFRGNIVPETCALIYLQGQIRAGAAQAEDFPLNLWDMERVYEGVYQFLEFFAVLTESNDWKGLLVEWEIVYDLVTLIKELDASIPKARLTTQIPPPPLTKTNGNTATKSTGAAPVAIERPYDPTAADSGLRRPVDESVPATEGGRQSPPLCTEDPAEFEWRNLKKLIVLVLSSLVWKSPTVQNQIREHGGVEVILGCTQYDAHNPYIKEHAVMCLKFLLEGNRENQGLVEGLEARQVADSGQEVLKNFGLEARIEQGGKVRLVDRGRGRERQAEGKTTGVGIAPPPPPPPTPQQQQVQMQTKAQAQVQQGQVKERRRSMGSVGLRNLGVDVNPRVREREKEREAGVEGLSKDRRVSEAKGAER